MRRPRSAKRQRARGGVRVAAVGAILAATSVAAGAGAAIGPQVTSKTLAYTCAFPSGPQQVSALISATLPATATVGQPIQPTAASLAITLPAFETRRLAGRHATSVTATASLAITTAWTGGSATSTWADLAAPTTRVPAKGGLTLTATGPVPPVTVTAPGAASVTAAGLSLTLNPRVATSDTMARAPAPIHAQCTPASGGNTTLATVTVTNAMGMPASRPPATQHGGSTTRSRTNYCPLKKVLPFNPRFPFPPYPHKGSSVNHGSGLPSWCAYIEGFSDVLKLKGAALVGPGFVNLNPALTTIFNFKDNYFQQDSAGELWYNGLHELPPAKATFLTFGFMPTTATILISEIGTMNLATVGPSIGCTSTTIPCITTASSRLQIHISNVIVNGVPLNVGPNCHTPPFDSVLTGSSATKPPYYLFIPAPGVHSGGPLTGTIKVPPFTGCGVGENLDPLFTSSISGSGNFSLFTQGGTCQQSSRGVQYGCPPEIPKPLRHISG